MKRFFSHKWVRLTLTHVLLVGSITAILTALSLLFGHACPTYLIFGICCPFCGMTRAHLSALQLDFVSALAYHPVFFTGLPFLWVLVHQHLFQKKPFLYQFLRFLLQNIKQSVLHFHCPINGNQCPTARKHHW